MSCETMLERATARLAGELPEGERRDLEAHLRECAACAGEAAALAQLWSELGELPVAAPSPRLRASFEALLARESSRARRTPLRFPSAAPRTAPAIGRWLLPVAATLLVGVGVGYLVGDRKRDDVAALEREVGSLREVVMTLSLLDHGSVSERLQGVSYGREASVDDERVVAALFTRLLEDPNVNVRLAAVEALRPQARRAGRRAELVAAVLRQDSPLVGLSLIDVLLESSVPAGRADLEELSVHPKLDPAIRGYLRDRLGRSA